MAATMSRSEYEARTAIRDLLRFRRQGGNRQWCNAQIRQRIASVRAERKPARTDARLCQCMPRPDAKVTWFATPDGGKAWDWTCKSCGGVQ